MKNNHRFRVDKILSCAIKDTKTGKTLSEWKFDACPMFDTCNYKTAMCRAVLPDASCCWYRYFKKLIEENERRQ